MPCRPALTGAAFTSGTAARAFGPDLTQPEHALPAARKTRTGQRTRTRLRENRTWAKGCVSYDCSPRRRAFSCSRILRRG
jgi:hypothetical protein